MQIKYTVQVVNHADLVICTSDERDWNEIGKYVRLRGIDDQAPFLGYIYLL